MLDIGWAELLVVGVVALLVVGPKELPGMLRTIGRYVGMVRRQANEFKAQFDEAIRETELDDIRKEVDAIRHDTTSTLRDVEKSVDVRASARLDGETTDTTPDRASESTAATAGESPQNGNGAPKPEIETTGDAVTDTPAASGTTTQTAPPRSTEASERKPTAQAGV